MQNSRSRLGRLTHVLAGCSLATALGTLASGVQAQTVSERVLGRIELQGTPGPGIVVARHGSNFARRERIDGGERFVTVEGPGETFDALLPGAVWIRDQLVYYARKGGKTFLVRGGSKLPIHGTPTSPAVAARLLPSLDRQHYIAFSTDGATVRWYLDGALQTSSFKRLALTPIDQPTAYSLFVAARGCDYLLVGHPPSGSAKWDLIHRVNATKDGTTVFVYGERAGRKLLRRNGKVVFEERLEAFERSADGKAWLAVVDRSADGVDRVELVRNGARLVDAPVDVTRQRLSTSGDGVAWVWQIVDADYVGSTLRRSNGPDRRVDQEIAELWLSEDGARLAIVTRDPENKTLAVEVDGMKVGSVPGMAPRTFRFGPGKSYAFVRRDGEKSAVISHLGHGSDFETVSAVWFMPDGRPGYIGSRAGTHVAVIGAVEMPLAATDVHHLDSLRLEAASLRVLGTRGVEVVDFTISAQ